MSRHKLTNAATITAPGRHSDGDGLFLVVRPTGTRAWSFVYRAGKKVVEIGLGRAAGPDGGGVSVDDAREKAAAMFKDRRNGNDPAAARRAEKEQTTTVDANTTFGELVPLHIKDVIAKRFKGGVDGKTASDWQRSIEIHAEKLLPMRPAAITTEDVLAVLRPIWESKPKTAAELRGRIERILDAAKVKLKLRTGDNPAAWAGNLKELLAAPVRRKKHHAAVPYKDLPAIIVALRDRAAANRNSQNLANVVVEFVAITALRSTEARKMRVREVNFEEAIVTIPAKRMKVQARTEAEGDHPVPLSPRAVEILRQHIADDAEPNDFVFKGLIRGQCLGENALLHALQRIRPDATVHGLRSSFEDWAVDKTDYPDWLSEMALAHAVGNEVSQAYRRTKALDKRRPMMLDWAAFIG